ncbi:MAG: (E)-4-hydroxy-3-methylbut-2-enyl-diphosphate synthase [Bacteroidetes bacterium]|uniref:4-hydroxy-3-methylbut-2-en-1-yl diphosphate synthase (flavodoxin) n=1 Tax=Candidatus Cryptobacteroides avistercoris TaxID=2840758 RepID=A0A9D9IX06_9BACT|nr:(E)-4-hydroxy-3-methylbut-2-enyl-diphosphate synthase [Candidatus Cryptobacteroides avistercoris]
MERLKTIPVRIGESLVMGGDSPIVVQTMCDTHTYDVDATVAQCLRLAEAGADLIRITVPGINDVQHIREIRRRLREAGCRVPLCADIHFSSETAIAVAPEVEKVRINPGNFHRDHDKAREQFSRLIEVCREHGTAIRIGLNHGSLGSYITERYGNTPFAMATAAMEWVKMCVEREFYSVVVSLKASNTVVMTQAYRELVKMMRDEGHVFPLHLGVTEAGGGDSARIKSCIGIAALLQEGIGDTIRVSLTEPPENELPVARYLAEGLKGDEMLDAAIEWGPKLLKREIDEIPASAGVSEYLTNEIMQAARRRFYKAEYIACPGCGRTMYDLQKTFAEVKARTSHLKGVVIAVMGCIVNGPGEMADADWGYVGEGGGKVAIYRKGEPVLRHIPDSEAIDKLLELIEAENA